MAPVMIYNSDVTAISHQYGTYIENMSAASFEPFKKIVLGKIGKAKLQCAVSWNN
jgi:hypothetical protein